MRITSARHVTVALDWILLFPSPLSLICGTYYAEQRVMFPPLSNRISRKRFAQCHHDLQMA
jgi:hypothetical protein